MRLAEVFRFHGGRSTASRPYFRYGRYERLTMVLTDRGVQPVVCRVIAASTASLGLIPVIMLASPAGAQSRNGRVLAVAATTCCILLAMGWLRGRWPTRNESRSFVLTGTVSTAVACLVPTSPDGGMPTMAAFVLLTGYAVALHGKSLAAVVWTVSAATLVALDWRVMHDDPALFARSFTLLTTMNVFAAAACQITVRLILADDETG